MRFLAPSLAFLAAACSQSGHPGGPTSTETALVTYQTCAALESDLRDMMLEEVEARFDEERFWLTNPPVIFDDGVVDAPPATTTQAPRQEGKDYSGTNDQEAGVDEADFVKTDGFHLYVVNGNRLHIYGVPAFGQLVPEAVMELEGVPSQLLLDKESGRLAVFSAIAPGALPAGHPLRAGVGEQDSRGGWSWRVQEISKITVIDAGDRRAPKLAREIYLEGSYRTARLVARSVRVTSYALLDIPGLDGFYAGWGGEGTIDIDQREQAAKAAVRALRLEEMVPRIYERLPDRTFTAYPITGDGCRRFRRPSDSQGRGVTSILSLDLATNNLRFDGEHIVSNGPNVYASRDRLYVAEAAHDWWWFWWNEEDDEIQNIHAFDIATPGETHYLGSGRVRGRIHDSFSMDDEGGNLRVATTQDRWERWWLDPSRRSTSTSHVFVLALQGGRLAQIGHLGGIAPGESIFSARFVGDRGYLVTYRMIDPLFTIDLSVPERPRIMGSLKVPGVSTYIHPLDDGRLLTVGWGGDEQLLSWRPQVSLFDVRDEEHPSLLDTEPLAGEAAYAWSEALYEHKAFQYWAPRKLLAVPVSSHTSSGDPRGWTWSYSSHLMLISVGESGLALHGDIDHSAYFNSDGSRQWLSTDIRRSIFMGDFIYAISDRAISVHRLDGMQLVTEQPLPGTVPSQSYWWW